jgi:hypothetical protein
MAALIIAPLQGPLVCCHCPERLPCTPLFEVFFLQDEEKRVQSDSDTASVNVVFFISESISTNINNIRSNFLFFPSARYSLFAFRYSLFAFRYSLFALKSSPFTLHPSLIRTKKPINH